MLGSNHSALIKAIREADPINVVNCITMGANVNNADDFGETPLSKAAQWSHCELIPLLVHAGANVDNLNLAGMTPLHKAICKDDIGMVIALLAAGANVNKADSVGMMPFFKAVMNSQYELVTILVAAGADVNQFDRFGETALHKTAYKGDMSMLAALLTAGAKTNIADKYCGKTPLHKAVFQYNIAVVSALLAAGADPHMTDNDGETPLCLAAQQGYTDIVIVLLNHYPSISLKKLIKISDVLEKAPLMASPEIHTAFAELCDKVLEKDRIISKQALSGMLENVTNTTYYLKTIIQKIYEKLGYDEIAPVESASFRESFLYALTNSFENPFKDPRCHAGSILQTIANVQDALSYAHLENNNTSSEDSKLILAANARFNTIIRSRFSARFTSIADIEKQIYSMLLDEKMKQLSTSAHELFAQKIFDFINENKQALIQREPGVLIESRSHFTSLDDIYDIALRALDSGAPCRLEGWPKLFVASPAEEEATIVFSMVEAHATELNRKTASDIARERLCYAYLVATDPELSMAEQAELILQFICMLAEISRAHNENELTHELDDPSCFPGTLPRIDAFYQKHPHLINPHDKIRELIECKILCAFKKALSHLTNLDDKQKLYDALTTFTDLHAWNIINHPKNVLDTELEPADIDDLFQRKQDFFESYFGTNGEKLIAEIKEDLAKSESMLQIEDVGEEFILQNLLNTGRITLSTTRYLTDIFLADRHLKRHAACSMSTFNPSESLEESCKKPVPFRRP